MDNVYMSHRLTRRQFFQTSIAAGVGAATLPGCAALDRFFGLEKSRFEQEVIIVGAGAAGLAAAYELKKAGIPYRLFEASPRIGGRIYSLENFNSDGQVAELGAEFFEDDDKLIFDWCNELNLPVDEIKFPEGLDRQVNFASGRYLPAKDMMPRLQKLITELVKMKIQLVGDRNEIITALNAHEFPEAQRLDELPLSNFLDQMLGRADAETLRIFKTSCVAQFGRRTEELSTLHLLNSIDLEAAGSKNLFRVRYGNQRLLRTIYERISGVLPEFFVRMNSPLLEIYENGDYFACEFQTPEGRRKYEAKYVILALPINHYKTIDGLEKLNLSTSKKESISQVDLAAHSKIVMSFKQRFWQKKQDLIPANRGSYFKDNLPLVTWDGSAGQEGSKGILSFLVGGPVSETSSVLVNENLLQEMQVFGKAFKTEHEGFTQAINWKQRPYTNGSFVAYKPGEFVKYHGIWSQSDYNGRLCYAGEHTHPTHYGTWIGALESGQKAALEIIQVQKAKMKKTAFT
jgi:monoamine oxidase